MVQEMRMCAKFIKRSGGDNPKKNTDTNAWKRMSAAPPGQESTFLKTGDTRGKLAST